MTQRATDTGHFPPAGQTEGKSTQVAAMFDAIAPRYDLLNRVLSGGTDRRWRRRAVRIAGRHTPERILDVATGTGDLAIEALKTGAREVVGVDIAERMLDVGRRKIEAMGVDDRVRLVRGDALDLPFPDREFDAALVAFGVRNFEHLERGLREIRRILRPGGVLVVLEFSRPRSFLVRHAYAFYSRYVLPAVGRIVSGDDGAYRYLPASISVFPDGADFLSVMESAGFGDLDQVRLTFGVASIYTGLA